LYFDVKWAIITLKLYSDIAETIQWHSWNTVHLIEGLVYVGFASNPGEYDSIPDEGCGTCCLFDSDVAVPFQVVPEGSILFH